MKERRRELFRLTNFARVVVSSHHHAATSIVGHWSTWTAHHVWRKWLAFVHGLHGEHSHMVRHMLEVLDTVDSFLSHHLYLGSSTASRQVSSMLSSSQPDIEVLPILEPDLNRSLGHVDFGRNSLACSGIGSRVLRELMFECHQLILSCPLPFLVLLLLCQSALPGRTPRGTVGASSSRIRTVGKRGFGSG